MLAGARPVQSVKFLQQPDLRGGYLSAQQQVVKLRPGQGAGHPAAEPAGLHQPRLELEPAAGVLRRRLVAAVVRAVAGVADGLRGHLDEG